MRVTEINCAGVLQVPPRLKEKCYGALTVRG